ncbi:putative small auxin-up RNA [Helianthus annuus]|nr:putative small auxin-up RNA [Helianthus annuus]
MPHIIQARKILNGPSLMVAPLLHLWTSPKAILPFMLENKEKKRFVVSVSLLSEPTFQELLHQAEEEFGYNHPMGGLTIPCSEDVFTDLASRLGAF